MELLKVFSLGISILVGALVLNFVASKLSLTTWYDFVKEPKDASIVSLLWLFFIYPLLLGVVAYIAMKLLKF